MATSTARASDGSTVVLDSGSGFATSFDAAGNQTAQRALTTQELASLAALDVTNTARINQATILAAAQTALTANTTYLAIPTPTQAQAVAQVTTLTREMNRVIRLILQQFDSAS